MRAVLAAGSLALVFASGAAAAAPPYSAAVRAPQWSELRGSYRAGCPVGPAELRTIRLVHWGFDARAHTGTLVVHRRVANDVVAIFRQLYAARFPIKRMVPVAVFGGSDDRSMAADNTSAFNCRFVGGTRRWSMHAYGLAIDVNPVENPYVSGNRVSPAAGRAYRDRRARPGVIRADDAAVRAFSASGWKWGGAWSTPDYQHFSTTGR